VQAQYDWSWESAERELRRAVELNPGQAESRMFLGLVLAERGDPAAGIPEHDHALALDPLSEYAQTVWAQPLYFGRRYDQLAARCRKLLEHEPGYAPAHALLGMCMAQQSKFDSAFVELRAARALADDPAFALSRLGWALGRSGRTKEARLVLDSLTALAVHEHVNGYSVALVHIGLGERDQAFEWLGRSFQNRDEDLDGIRVDPALDPLRHDPRYADLVRRMKLD
jgi:serine/threonine-protein kinase